MANLTKVRFVLRFELMVREDLMSVNEGVGLGGTISGNHLDVLGVTPETISYQNLPVGIRDHIREYVSSLAKKGFKIDLNFFTERLIFEMDPAGFERPGLVNVRINLKHFSDLGERNNLKGVFDSYTVDSVGKDVKSCLDSILGTEDEANKLLSEFENKSRSIRKLLRHEPKNEKKISKEVREDILEEFNTYGSGKKMYEWDPSFLDQYTDLKFFDQEGYSNRINQSLKTFENFLKENPEKVLRLFLKDFIFSTPIEYAKKLKGNFDGDFLVVARDFLNSELPEKLQKLPVNTSGMNEDSKNLFNALNNRDDQAFCDILTSASSGGYGENLKNIEDIRNFQRNFVLEIPEKRADESEILKSKQCEVETVKLFNKNRIKLLLVGVALPIILGGIYKAFEKDDAVSIDVVNSPVDNPFDFDNFPVDSLEVVGNAFDKASHHVLTMEMGEEGSGSVNFLNTVMFSRDSSEKFHLTDKVEFSQELVDILQIRGVILEVKKRGGVLADLSFSSGDKKLLIHVKESTGGNAFTRMDLPRNLHKYDEDRILEVIESVKQHSDLVDDEFLIGVTRDFLGDDSFEDSKQFELPILMDLFGQVSAAGSRENYGGIIFNRASDRKIGKEGIEKVWKEMGRYRSVMGDEFTRDMVLQEVYSAEAQKKQIDAYVPNLKKISVVEKTDR